MRKPTIYQIRNGYEMLAREQGKEAHFFDRGTLKFFHETMSSLRVIKTKFPRVFGVKTRHGLHFFGIHGDGKGYPFCFYVHLGTTLLDSYEQCV